MLKLPIPEINGFYHICMVKSWRKIVSEQIELIQASTLYDKTKKIYIGCLGHKNEKSFLEEMIKPLTKIKIIFYNSNIKLAEIPTLQIAKS